MKKTCLSMTFFALSIAANAQLTVLNNGKTYLGNFPNNLQLSNNDPENDVTLQIFGKGNFGCKGMIAFGDYGELARHTRNVVIGEYGTTDTDQLWLHGKNGIFLTYNDGEKIIGCYNRSNGNKFTFNTPVWAEGVKLTSDERLKTEIEPIHNSLSNLMKLNGVSYNLHSKPTAGESGLRAAKVYDKRSIGLIAQDLMTVYPELVDQDSDGYYAVDYIGLIPVLIESIKEQQNKIDELSEKLENFESRKSNNYALDEALAIKPLLKQNAPNPFKNETVIEYSVPENSTSASIFIYDMTGAQLKEYKVSTRENKLTIKGSEFKAGMYIYSLIVDGQLIDTKRMTLTK